MSGWFALLTLPAALAGWYVFVRHYEVPHNARAILDNGSADDLRKGFHQRRGNVRALVAAALALIGACPAPSWLAFGLLAAALLVLMAGAFARFFSPELSLARGMPEFYCSSDSASWPDALIWRKLRAANPNVPTHLLQAQARLNLATLLYWCWYSCLALAGILAVIGFYYCLR